MSRLTVTEIRTEDDRVAWDRYVRDHPMASGYHLVTWRRIVEAAFGHSPFYLVAKNEAGGVQGVLPLVFLSGRLFGRLLVSMPYFNYGGVLADCFEAQEALLASAVELARQLKAIQIELRQHTRLELEWASKQHKVSMRLELPGEFETLWKGFPSKLRSQVRRAQEEGMIVRVGREESLDDFYQVFSRNMRDLGTPVYGRNFFKLILQSFPKEARICAVYWKDRPLAAGFLYGFRNVLEIPWACSDRRHSRLAANMLLYNSALEYACREGFGVFDFGRSTPGSGSYRFKEQWGARPVQLYWYHWSANGGPPLEINPQNPKYSVAIKVWRRLPIALTKIIGPVIVRNIP